MRRLFKKKKERKIKGEEKMHISVKMWLAIETLIKTNNEKKFSLNFLLNRVRLVLHHH